jgi:multidrug efflux pump subunit AcrB
VADAVRKTSLDLPAGRIKTTSGEILVRTKGRRYHAEDYRNVAVVSRSDGSLVTLGEVAQLKDGFEDVDLFALVGAVAGHLIMGMDLSILSLCGMVGLTGVVVNDSLVLIYTTNRERKQGSSAHNAITNGAAIRFRAIILTFLTTFAGLTPMLLEKSLQAKFLIPMAVSLGFGVLFATFITLLLIPCGYLILEDMHNIWRVIWERLVNL